MELQVRSSRVISKDYLYFCGNLIVEKVRTKLGQILIMINYNCYFTRTTQPICSWPLHHFEYGTPL